jgi:hypothetical protein
MNVSIRAVLGWMFVSAALFACGGAPEETEGSSGEGEPVGVAEQSLYCHAGGHCTEDGPGWDCNTWAYSPETLDYTNIRGVGALDCFNNVRVYAKVRMRLQKRVDGTWMTVAGSTKEGWQVSSGYQTYELQHQARVPYQNGTFRTQITAWRRNSSGVWSSPVAFGTPSQTFGPY